MKKRTVGIVLLSVLLFALFVSPALALTVREVRQEELFSEETRQLEQKEKELYEQANRISVSVKGELVQWTDAEPFIDNNDRTLVPLRAVAEALGINANWDGVNRQAIFNSDTQFIVFRIDNNIALSYNFDGVDQTNLKEIEMDTRAVIVNDRTYAPVRYLAEYFGYSVDWNGETRTVIIK